MESKYKGLKAGQWNKIVYEYLLQEKAVSYGFFLLFLERNNLPPERDWILFCLGRWFGEGESIAKELIETLVSNENLDEEMPEIFFWDKYISICTSKMRMDGIATPDLESEDFIKNGWDYIREEIKFYKEYESWGDGLARKADGWIDRSYEDQSFCSSCGESPCMCSDPEQTSTTYRE